jgi:uncharacterized membrane-anchored protein YitT (DUF2179 family)
MLSMTSTLNQKKFFTELKSYLLLTIGALILAVNFNIFLLPHQIAPGGIGGVTLMIALFTGWSEGVILLMLQVMMVFLGFWYLGRFQFLIRALYVSLVLSFGVDFLKPLLPAGGVTNDLLLNTIFGGLVGGIGGGLIYWGRSSVAGTSVISRIIQYRTGLPISQIYIFVDGFVILLQAMVFGWDKALYGMMMLFVDGMASDYVLEGPSVVCTAFIVTEQPEEIAITLMEKLHVGVTSWHGTGMFTHEQRTVMFCTISRVEMNPLRRLVRETDPSAFIVVGYGHQASGGVVRRAPKNVPAPVRK